VDTARLTSPHFIAGVALLIATLALLLSARNPSLRRRLRITVGLAAAAVAAHLAIVGAPLPEAYFGDIFSVEKLLLTLAAIHGVMTLAFHPWFSEHATERAPGIVQGALVITVFLLVVTLVFPEQLLAASAVGAVVVGFALQDTLGNFFAGLALQIDRPFKPGHWIEVGPFQGRVTDITWRATRIVTKTGNMVIVPNNIVGKEAITNYSEPGSPTRLAVEVGTGYELPPNIVREAIMTAMSACPLVLPSPAPDVVMIDFGASALQFRARFWVREFDEFNRDDHACDQVRNAIYYEFRRRNIEIPWPIQIEYGRTEVPKDLVAEQKRFAAQMATVPIFATLGPEVHGALAAAAREQLFARDEVIVREGDPGGSMFLVTDGAVVISVGPDRREVAVTETGGYFGEMSLLTGDARSATVTARRDSTLLEVSADAFGAHVRSQPSVLDALAAAAAARRAQLDAVKSAPGAAPAPTQASLLARMRKFFRLA
jgi:small-conductance mechanosensitive channel